MIVMIDIDDCLMPWAMSVHEQCIERGWAEPGSLYASWSMWESYKHPDGRPVTKEDWLEVVDAMVVPGGLYHQPPYPGAAEAVRELYWEGHEVHLVTARGFMAHAEEIRAWTAEWVEEFALPGRLEFAKDKDRVALEIGATHAVDDGVHNFEALTCVGVDAYLLNQPHNATAPIPSVLRVNSVREFVDKILKEAA